MCDKEDKARLETECATEHGEGGVPKEGVRSSVPSAQGGLAFPTDGVAGRRTVKQR